MIITLAGHSCTNTDPNYRAALTQFFLKYTPMKSVPDYDIANFNSACQDLCRYYQSKLYAEGLLEANAVTVDTISLQFNGYRADLNGVVDTATMLHPTHVSDTFFIRNPYLFHTQSLPNLP